MSDVIRRRADGSWGQGDDVPTYASDYAETWSGTADKSMDHVSDEYAKQMAAQKERNLEEEAHQLGLSSWDRVDKWLKRKKKIITTGNPRSDSKDLENLFMDNDKGNDK